MIRDRSRRNPRAPLSVEDDEERQALDPWAIAIGGLIVSIGVSSLLDDTTTLHHPWWTVFVLAALLLCLIVVARTVQRLLSRHAPAAMGAGLDNGPTASDGGGDLR